MAEREAESMDWTDWEHRDDSQQ